MRDLNLEYSIIDNNCPALLYHPPQNKLYFAYFHPSSFGPMVAYHEIGSSKAYEIGEPSSLYGKTLLKSFPKGFLQSGLNPGSKARQGLLLLSGQIGLFAAISRTRNKETKLFNLSENALFQTLILKTDDLSDAALAKNRMKLIGMCPVYTETKIPVLYPEYLESMIRNRGRSENPNGYIPNW